MSIAEPPVATIPNQESNRLVGTLRLIFSLPPFSVDNAD